MTVDIVSKALRDPDFRADLKREPAKVLRESGYSLPESTTVRVLESSPDEIVIALLPLMSEDGPELSEDVLGAAVGGVTPMALSPLYATPSALPFVGITTIGGFAVGGLAAASRKRGD